ncbi:MAG: hypothetical protein ABI837_15295, partial [Acidobacteriota bacterium]
GATRKNNQQLARTWEFARQNGCSKTKLRPKVCQPTLPAERVQESLAAERLFENKTTAEALPTNAAGRAGPA